MLGLFNVSEELLKACFTHTANIFLKHVLAWNMSVTNESATSTMAHNMASSVYSTNDT